MSDAIPPALAPRPQGAAVPSGPYAGLGPLLMLARLRLRGKLRAALAGLRQPKRLLVLLLGAGLVGAFILIQTRGDADARPFGGASADTILPLFLTFFVATSCLAALRNGVMAFTPAEIHFLFPGPVGTRALIASHLAGASLKSLSGALVFSLFLHFGDGARWRSAVGYLLVFQLLVVLGMFVDLAHLHLERSQRSRRAWLWTAAMLAWVVGSVAAAWWVDDQRFGLGVLRWAVAPGRLFSGIFSGSVGEALLHAAGALTLVAGLAWRCLTWDRPVRASALAASDRVQQTLKRFDKSGMPFAGVAGRSDGRVLPRLPSWGGAGPHVWRQLTAMRRRRLAFGIMLAFTVVLTLVITFASGTPRPEAGGAMAMVLLLWMGPFYVQCDFRADYGALPWLRSLPTSATALAAGQLLASTLVLTALQLVLGGWAIAFAPLDRLPYWALGLLSLPLLNLTMFAVENGVYLVSPVRLDHSKGAPGAVQIVRIYGLLITKLLVLAVVLGLAVLPGWGVGWFTGSVLTGLVVGWISLGFEAALLVVIVGRIFRWIDPSRDLTAE